MKYQDARAILRDIAAAEPWHSDSFITWCRFCYMGDEQHDEACVWVRARLALGLAVDPPERANQDRWPVAEKITKRAVASAWAYVNDDLAADDPKRAVAADPELERLLNEEEEIEARQRAIQSAADEEASLARWNESVTKLVKNREMPKRPAFGTVPGESL